VGVARAGPRPLVVSPGHCLPSSLLLALWVFWQNRFFAIFFEIFPESRISAQKRDTRAILLKTALVRVSCIQNTQIRGKTIAKVFRKVDTFWTYQLPPSLAIACPQAIHLTTESDKRNFHEHICFIDVYILTI
jgi:hypothetical protein